jgi:hypothetical protein
MQRRDAPQAIAKASATVLIATALSTGQAVAGLEGYVDQAL